MRKVVITRNFPQRGREQFILHDFDTVGYVEFFEAFGNEGGKVLVDCRLRPVFEPVVGGISVKTTVEECPCQVIHDFLLRLDCLGRNFRTNMVVQDPVKGTFYRHSRMQKVLVKRLFRI